MYRKLVIFFKSVFLQILAIYLCTFLLAPVAFSQQRRGVFLQDPPSGQKDPTGFRGFGDEPDDLGAEGDDYSTLGGSSRYRGRGSQDSLMDRGLIYQVHVLGEVKKPGTYRVSPSMRVTDALQLAGNVKTSGTERFVEVRKAGQGRGQVLDLFAYKTLGQLSQNPYLEDNETIFIPLKKRAIQIEGPVRRPGIFELKSERFLQQVIDLAGGFTVGVDPKQPLKVIRYGGHTDKEILEIYSDSPNMGAFEVKDGDVIVVPHKFLANHQFDYNLKQLPNDNIFYPSQEDRVFVIGAVRGPGAFDFNQYYSLRQYLTLAGGTTTMAKNKQIKVVTVDGQTYKAKDGNYDRLINPGDTIVVPEKSIPTSFYIGLLPTIASLGLSATALFK
ncbi:hypothetical protein FBR05_00090 [Deltaproteobacteria bacterium PRO3]|nr:hypothetical protein [Deltaproteobacteria bacterium PRO3]